MSRVEFQMKIRGPLHMGTGMSRIAEIDRVVRRSPRDEVVIEGEQLKGAVRAAAERLLRWLGGVAEDDQTSYPGHPVLERLFAPGSKRFVRFEAAKPANVAKVSNPSSTAIDHNTGAAKARHLRTIEIAERGAAFECGIALYGDWSGQRETRDVLFLCAALLSMDAIGSRRGTGFGAVEIHNLTYGAVDLTSLATAETILALQAHVQGDPQ